MMRFEAMKAASSFGRSDQNCNRIFGTPVVDSSTWLVRRLVTDISIQPDMVISGVILLVWNQTQSTPSHPWFLC